MGILPYNSRMSGQMEFDGRVLDEKEKARLRGKEIFLVPQSVAYLDPLMKVGEQVTGGDKSPAARERCRDVLSRYGLETETAGMYPYQLSGGMARRVLISTAVMGTPRLVIADEPTPGVPTETALRVLGHFREIAEQGAGVLLITHDLELAVKTADRIVVFYGGMAVEECPAGDFGTPGRLRHPYTRALCDAMPERAFTWIPGTQPAVIREEAGGCPFADRCPEREEALCGGEIAYEKKNGGFVRCARA